MAPYGQIRNRRKVRRSAAFNFIPAGADIRCRMEPDGDILDEFDDDRLERTIEAASGEGAWKDPQPEFVDPKVQELLRELQAPPPRLRKSKKRPRRDTPLPQADWQEVVQGSTAATPVPTGTEAGLPEAFGPGDVDLSAFERDLGGPVKPPAAPLTTPPPPAPPAPPPVPTIQPRATIPAPGQAWKSRPLLASAIGLAILAGIAGAFAGPFVGTLLGVAAAGVAAAGVHFLLAARR